MPKADSLKRNPPFDRWCYSAIDDCYGEERIPVLTTLYYKVCEGDDVRMGEALRIAQLAFEAGQQAHESPEPFYIRQTAAPEHLEPDTARQAWFHGALADAYGVAVRGRMKLSDRLWPRFTVDGQHKAILIEVWLQRPLEEGEPRWEMAEGDEHVD